jgi:DNA mismatch endonuclease, patch repair protein
MSDVFSKAKRSELMSRIRSRGNKDTEVALAKLFRRNKITGWRRQRQLRVGELRVERRRTSPRPSPQRGEGGARASVSSLFTRHSSLTVRPDFVFPKSRTAVFVDGCFWHGCPKHGTQPKGNRAFWKNKFASNKARDLLVTRTLRRAGWRVLRIWEHELARKNEIHLLRRIQRALI